MREAGDKVVVVRVHEDLGLVGESADGGAVNDPVSVSLKVGAEGIRWFLDRSSF